MDSKPWQYAQAGEVWDLVLYDSDIIRASVLCGGEVFESFVSKNKQNAIYLSLNIYSGQIISGYRVLGAPEWKQ